MKDQADELREIMSSKNIRSQKIIAISSGKGGVGKTNLAVNLGIAFNEFGKKVLIIDADLGLANVNVIFGNIPSYTLLHVVKGIKTLPEVIVDTDYGVKYIAGSSGFSDLANLSHRDLLRLINGLEYLNDIDIILLDTGAGISDTVLYFILAADASLIITTPEPTAMLDAYGIIKSIASEDKSKIVNLVVNRVQKETDAVKIGKKISDIAHEYLSINVNYLGYIYEDKTVPYAVSKQFPFYAYDDKCRAAICLNNLAKSILHIDKSSYKKGIGIQGFFEKIFYSKSN